MGPAGRGGRVRYVRWTLVLGYVWLVLLSARQAWVPCVLWTMMMPAFPLALSVLGFSWWRGVCPIAAFGALGARASKAQGARVPRWLRGHPMTVSLILLGALLVWRLVAVNGDAPLLGATLAGLALVAMGVNFAWGGRSFCNHVCPVGVVERIYTDGARPGVASAACEPCTGCTRRCPDADQPRAFAHDLHGADRRRATLAFPGLVLGFYAYYYLRGGSWDAFFSGAWTTEPPHPLGPGLTFAPSIPAIVAAPLTLLVTSAVSALVLGALERRLGDAGDARPRILSLAAFLAFTSFYQFAGAPTLLRIPGVHQVVMLVACVVATLVLAQRWAARSRTRDGARTALIELRLHRGG
jgi:hypothetical protein